MNQNLEKKRIQKLSFKDQLNSVPKKMLIA